jgi:predicted transcriptional regulator
MRLPGITYERLYNGDAVNFNVYLDKSTVDRLDRLAKARGVKRNTLIREAVDRLLAHETRAGWPAAVLAHEGVAGPAFEAARSKLRAPRGDPLA